MYVLVTYKNECKDQIKNEGARVVTTIYSYILDIQVQLTQQKWRWSKHESVLMLKTDFPLSVCADSKDSQGQWIPQSVVGSA